MNKKPLTLNLIRKVMYERCPDDIELDVFPEWQFPPVLYSMAEAEALADMITAEWKLTVAQVEADRAARAFFTKDFIRRYLREAKPSHIDEADISEIRFPPRITRFAELNAILETLWGENEEG